MSFWQENKTIFTGAAVSIAILIAAWLIYWALRKSINGFSRRRKLAETDPGAETRFRMIERLSAVVIFFIAVGLVFWVIDIQALNNLAKGMFVSAGIVGIAVGFAAQTTIANLFSGIIIAFAQPIRLGDSVNIDGEFGVVESIGLFYTQIRVWDNRRLVIPNKLLSDQTIRNYTLIDPRSPALVTLRLDYGADIEAVRGLLLEEAQRHPLFLADPKPSVRVIEADNLGVTVRLMAWAAAQANAFTMATEVREAVLARAGGRGVPGGHQLGQGHVPIATAVSGAPDPGAASSVPDPGAAREPLSGEAESAGRGIWGLDRNVFWAGVTSFLMDVSSEMIYSLVPIFLSSVLGVNKSLIGLIEGIAEATASMVKMFSGWFSDHIGRRKPLMLFGYGISTLSRPLLALSTGWGMVLGARFIDRFGKGVRTAPRDAIIADSAPRHELGRSFGFHRAMDQFGAVVGPAIAFVVLALHPGQYRLVFWISMIPGVICVAVIWLFIRERRTASAGGSQGGLRRSRGRGAGRGVGRGGPALRDAMGAAWAAARPASFLPAGHGHLLPGKLV